MRAAVLERRGADGVSWRDFADPAPAPGESVLKVAASALNRVDLYMRDSGVGITHALPQVMGVEAAGEIVEAEPGSGLKKGAKAILFSEAFCGKCRYCLAGDQPLCESVKIMGEHRHGGFAEYIAMPSRCFFPLPDEADLIAAGALATGHLTAWRMLFGKRALRPGESLLIVGIGGASPLLVCNWRSWSARGSSSPRRAMQKSRAPWRWGRKAGSIIPPAKCRRRSWR
jgi:D-arabinose 1-dehydrogenase-like Zn-dependent alcohol dehydrogenase